MSHTFDVVDQNGKVEVAGISADDLSEVLVKELGKNPDVGVVVTGEDFHSFEYAPSDYQHFAAINFERYLEDEHADVVSIDTEDMFVVDPHLSECGRFTVIPEEEYGIHFEAWKKKANRVLSKLSDKPYSCLCPNCIRNLQVAC